MHNLLVERGGQALALKARNSQKKQKLAEDERVKFVVERFNNSWTYAQTNYHSRWEDSWKLYNNRRVKIGYEGISNVFVPMTFSTIETMVSALAGSKPQFDFLPPRDKPDQNTDILNALLDFYWDKDQWNIKVQNWVRSMLIYGTGVVYLYWNIDHPVMVNIPVRDFFFDPNAVSLENCSKDFYAGRRYLTTVEELKGYEVVDSEEYEADSATMKPKYMNLDKIVAGSGATDGDETDKEKKDLFYGSTAPDPENTQIEVLELWTEDRVVSIANRSVLIQDEENPYLVQAKARGEKNAKGIIPFVVQRDFVDESLFYGRGEVEIFADLQEWLNDLTNQNNDAITYTLNPMWNLNPNKADLIEQIQSAPGAVFPLDSTDLAPVPMPSIPNDAFNERINIKNEIRETTAVNEVVKGVTNETKVTATEINAQVAQAGQRIGMKITQLENEGFHRLARVVFEMVKLYVNEPMLVRVVSDRVSWEQFNPEEFSGDYEPRVQLETSVEAKKQDDMAIAKEMFLALSQDPEVDQIELKRIALPKMFGLDPDEVDRLLVEPQAMLGTQDMGVPDPLTGEPLMPEMAPEEMLV